MGDFVRGEMSGSGLGTLSNGGKLVSEIKETGYRSGGNIDWYANKESVSNAWHDVQGDLTPDALDTRTLGKQIFFGLSYPGGDNPKKYNGNYDYSYLPTNPVEYPAIGHDRRYDNLGIAGGNGLLSDSRAIGADWRFVGEEFAVAGMSNNLLHKSQAYTLGIGLGFLASFKTLGQISNPGDIEKYTCGI
jgi:hypothetical protein